MEKNLFSLIVERVAADEKLRKKVATVDEAEFEVLLRENGVKDIPADKRAGLLVNLKSQFNEEGELTDEAINKAAAGSGGGYTCNGSWDGKIPCC